jgi:hypothetical protein
VQKPSAHRGGRSFIAAGLVIGMLFEGRSRSHIGSFLAILLLAVILYALFTVLAGNLAWARAIPEQWVGHVALDSISIAVVLHVGIARRRPFGTPDDDPAPAERT